MGTTNTTVGHCIREMNKFKCHYCRVALCSLIHRGKKRGAQGRGEGDHEGFQRGRRHVGGERLMKGVSMGGYEVNVI